MSTCFKNLYTHAGGVGGGGGEEGRRDVDAGREWEGGGREGEGEREREREGRNSLHFQHMCKLCILKLVML